MRYRCGDCGNEWEGKEWRSPCPRCGQIVVGIPSSPRRPDNPEKLIQNLLSLQREKGWLPREALLEVSERLKVPLSRVYQMATFYKTFSTSQKAPFLTPRGRHLLGVCMGTPCKIRGAQAILERLTQLLGVEPGGTTGDGRFTLEVVNCLGCCAMAPVAMVDEEYFGRLDVTQVEKLVKGYE